MQSDRISGHTLGGYPIGDRAISARDLADIDREIYGDGIISTAEGSGTYYQVSADSGMNIKVNPGKCYIQGRKASTPSDTIITISAPDALINRTDRVILRLDLNTEVRDVVIDVKTGDTSLIRTSSIWELGLADISVRRGATSILPSDITDLRFNSDICGRAFNELLHVDTTGIFDQIQSIISNQEAEWVDQTETQQATWQNQTTQQASAWQNQTETQEADFRALYEEMRTTYEALETQSFNLINNNFDDWSVKRGCNKLTTFNADGSITEAITVEAISFLLANRLTTFNTDGSITETVTFNPWTTDEGGNTIDTTAFTINKVTTFNANGTISEVIR